MKENIMDFTIIKNAVQQQFNKLSEGNLFTVDLDKDELYALYLSSFPEGTNPLYKERTEHDCNCCKSFIRAVGNVVGIIDNKVQTIWDISVDGPYQVVADALSQYVKQQVINSVFLSSEKTAGTHQTRQIAEETGSIITWDHFYVSIPKEFVRGDDLGKVRGQYNEDKGVFKRSVTEITKEAIDIVLELIDQNSLYRGEEHKATVKALQKEKSAFDKVPAELQDNYCWNAAARLGSKGRFRNTVIGTLLCDISDGKDLDKAVKSFEDKVAPQNYKRSSAVVTKGMIQQAQKKVEELGLIDALQRRYAVVDDISINDILFADRSTKKAMNVFDEMVKQAPKKIKNLDKVEEVSSKDFIEKILPKADSLEVMVDNSHTGNLFSLIAPEDKDAPNMLKWGNNFSWTYNGEVTDGLRERVEELGGRVDGVIRFTHTWNYDKSKPNQSLMDLHVFMPHATCKAHKDGMHDDYPHNGRRVGWNQRKHLKSGGVQDVDYTSAPGTFVPVENITFPDIKKLPEGEYVFKIHNWSARNPNKSGFKAQIELNGVVYDYEYAAPLKNKEWVTVAKAVLKNGQFTIQHMIPESKASKDIWGINTMNFHKVNMVMKSPNHWEGQKVGNEHLFFVLDGCNSGESSRGLYSEFLRDDLTPHRKVFEMLGSKMRVPESDEQLSGLGFSSTKRDSVICKVSGSFNRVVKINF